MDYFHKMYYNIRSSKERDKIAEYRYNFHSTIKTGLEIKPIDQSNIFELFYIPTNKTMNLIQEIIFNDRKLDEGFNILPGVAKTKFLIEIIAEEVYSTNELEGVKSSKREIAESTKSLIFNKQTKNKRLNSMIISYLELTDKGLKLPNSSKDIRKIYDNITHGEIKTEELPDGEIFRKDINYIYRNEKIVHRGVYPESNIIEKVEKLISFMNNKDNKINDLVKIAISHYYFGYIHPFYDGNGRTGRFISSLYLREVLSEITALSLSRGCIINRTNYLKIFDVTNKIISRGELNYFVDEFLYTLISGQRNLLTGLNEKIELINMGHEKIKIDTNIKTEDELNIMFILIQDYYFSIGEKGITVKDIANSLGYSDVTVRRKLKQLEDKDLIKRIKSNPLIYIIADGYLE